MKLLLLLILIVQGNTEFPGIHFHINLDKDSLLQCEGPKLQVFKENQDIATYVTTIPPFTVANGRCTISRTSTTTIVTPALSKYGSSPAANTRQSNMAVNLQYYNDGYLYSYTKATSQLEGTWTCPVTMYRDYNIQRYEYTVDCATKVLIKGDPWIDGIDLNRLEPATRDSELYGYNFYYDVEEHMSVRCESSQSGELTMDVMHITSKLEAKDGVYNFIAQDGARVTCELNENQDKRKIYILFKDRKGSQHSSTIGTPLATVPPTTSTSQTSVTASETENTVSTPGIDIANATDGSPENSVGQKNETDINYRRGKSSVISEVSTQLPERVTEQTETPELQITTARTTTNSPATDVSVHPVITVTLTSTTTKPNTKKLQKWFKRRTTKKPATKKPRTTKKPQIRTTKKLPKTTATVKMAATAKKPAANMATTVKSLKPTDIPEQLSGQHASTGNTRVHIYANSTELSPVIDYISDYQVKYSYIYNKPTNVTMQCRVIDGKDKPTASLKWAYDDKNIKVITTNRETNTIYLVIELNENSDGTVLDCKDNSVNEKYRIFFKNGSQSTAVFQLKGKDLPYTLNATNNVLDYYYKDTQILDLLCSTGYTDAGPVITLRWDFTDENGTAIPLNTNQDIVDESVTQKQIRRKFNLSEATDLCTIKCVKQKDDGDDNITYKNLTINLRYIWPVTTPPPQSFPKSNYTDADLPGPGPKPSEIGMYVGMSIAVFILVLILYQLVSYVFCKRKPRKGQGDPSYQNLNNETSIPSYPPQFEENYAVPADINHIEPDYVSPGRVTDDTYTVPYNQQNTAEYAQVKPKSQRNLTNNAIYSQVLPKNQRNDTAKRIEEAGYAEIVHDGHEQDTALPTYSAVVPKSKRNQEPKPDVAPKKDALNKRSPTVANDYIIDESPANETEYAEVSGNKYGNLTHYSNLNNKPYVNSNVNTEYAEPAYQECKGST